MNHHDIQNLIALAALIFTIFCSAITFITWYIKSEKRQYGLERDIAHLKRNYEQMTQTLDLLLNEIDHRFDSLGENVDSLDKILVELKSIISLKLQK